MIEARPAVAAFALAALLGAVPAFAQTSPEPGNLTTPDAATAPAPAPAPADPDAPSANSVDGTGTFSVNPPLATDPGLGGTKNGPSRTDMNAEGDRADVNDSAPGPQMPASSQ